MAPKEGRVLTGKHYKSLFQMSHNRLSTALLFVYLELIHPQLLIAQYSGVISIVLFHSSLKQCLATCKMELSRTVELFSFSEFELIRCCNYCDHIEQTLKYICSPLRFIYQHASMGSD